MIVEGLLRSMHTKDNLQLLQLNSLLGMVVGSPLKGKIFRHYRLPPTSKRFIYIFYCLQKNVCH